ncbi:MAG TPA: DUF1289 domain-containing protein [Arenibaculum sp.]|nr:DUF1289 domain-containing protein [Arenibaculum sp.]
MDRHDTSNPCIGICRFDADGACRGCLRTRTEVKAWKSLDDTRKAAVNHRVRPLIAAVTEAGKRRRKRRKLDRKIRKLEARLAELHRKRARIGEPPGE